MAGKKHCVETKVQKQPLETSILDDFSPVKLKKILPTSTKKNGDAMNSFRPNKGECLSYDISQTVLKMEAGDIKINVKNTEATYVPAPPVTPKKKKKIPVPPYKFINEIWLENQTVLEERYKDENRRYFKLKKMENRIKAEKRHHHVLSMGGPDWFQELSPNQLRTVNQLECCILKDVKADTITNVQENITKLGLVLRPNHRHIEKALHLCHKNPVEFLLILYQVMNPKRKVYSLNDRLLLSAVTHLCMTQTLRELHVRIPSPPVRKRVRRIKPKVEKKVKYPSPYLEPLFFTPVPPECTGVYENPHIQYPESPYFSYLQTMHIDRFMAEDVLELDLAKFNAREVELYEDMKRAQILYNQIRKGKRVKLLRPTIMEKCKMPIMKKRISVKLPSLSTFDDPEEKCTCGEKLIQGKCAACLAREREKRTQRIIKGITITRNNEAVPIIDGTLPQEICDSVQKYKDNVVAVGPRKLLQCQKVKYVIGGVAMTKVGPIYILSTALKKVKKNMVIDPNLSEQTEEKDEAVQETAEEYDGEPKTHEISTNTKDDTNEHDLSSSRSDDAEYEGKENLNLYNESMTMTAEVRFRKDKFARMRKKFRNISGLKGKRLFGDTPASGWEGSCLERTISTEAKEDPMHILPEEKDEAVLGELSESVNKTVQEIAEGNGGEPKSHEISTNTKGGTSEHNSSSSRSDDAEYESKENLNLYNESMTMSAEVKYIQHKEDRLIKGIRNIGGMKGRRLFQDTSASDWQESYLEKTISTEAKDKSQEAQLVIGGVTSTNEGPVDILSSSLSDRKEEAHSRTKSSSRQEKTVTVEDEEETKQEDIKYSGCKCRQELERFLKHECTCEECKKRIKKEVTHIIGGTTCNNDKNAVNIIQGIYEQRCDCLAKYKEKIDRLDDYRKRIEARYHLKSQALKFSIGGVASGPHGPVYVITGMRSPVDCECAKAARRNKEEEQRVRQMARMPPTGRIKYQITGVRNTPEGNVFIISQALAVGDCECIKLYDTFSQAHHACLDMYETYLRQTNKVLEEYVYKEVENFSQREPDLIEINEPTEPILMESIDMHELHSDNSFSNYNLFEKGEVVRGIMPKCTGQKLNICSRGEVDSLSGASVISQCACCADNNEEEETLSDSSEESQQCINVCLRDSKSGILPVKEEKPGQAEVKQELKRFVILKKIPCDYKKQLRILKKVLATMAEDDFPLAKLPDCHRLPHFKLWMAMRCGKFWTQKEINSTVPFSKRYWYHTGVCPIHYRVPSLGITRKEANEMTWNQAQYIKKIVAEKTEAFYREINQNTVENAREFFPMSFSYEFPNKTFRDVFFSYLPSKEKDTLSYHVMKPHDMRVISKRYSYYC